MTGRKISVLYFLLILVLLGLPSSAFSVEITKKGKQNIDRTRIVRPLPSIRTTDAVTKGLTTVSLSGRVVTPTGRPIKNAKIILMDLDGPTQVTVSGDLGFYSISGIVAGRTYVLGVFHKRYIFASPTQTLEINTDQNNVILLGEENW
jgi:hypothetical protein